MKKTTNTNSTTPHKGSIKNHLQAKTVPASTGVIQVELIDPSYFEDKKKGIPKSVMPQSFLMLKPVKVDVSKPSSVVKPLPVPVLPSKPIPLKPTAPKPDLFYVQPLNTSQTAEDNEGWMDVRDVAAEIRRWLKS